MRVTGLLFAFVFIASPQTQPEPDFRQSTWGMTRDQVITAEGQPKSEMPGGDLYYEVQLDSLKTGLLMRFAGGQLAETGYVLQERYTEPSLYMTAADRWLKALKAKYGEPRTVVNWRNPLYKRNEARWAFAVAAGHLTITYHWETARTSIMEILTGKNFRTSLTIAYSSKELQEAMERKKTEEQTKVF